MKAFLMYRDRDFDADSELPPNQLDLTQDLGLDSIFDAMASGDGFLRRVATCGLFLSLDDPGEIRYRQAVLSDCLDHPSVVREIYEVALQAILGEKKIYVGFFRDSPESILRRSVKVLELFVTLLRALRKIADREAGVFRSEGFTRFFAEVRGELGDTYFLELEDHLDRLRFSQGVHVSSRLGRGNFGVDYVLRQAPQRRWLERLAVGDHSSYSFRIPDRDESGARALARLRDRGVNLVANALAQSTDHILSYFAMIRSELAFYVGALNLHERLTELGDSWCLPTLLPSNERTLACRELYDVGLSLTSGERPVGNDVVAEATSLVIVTGANQGGKSTFLRSLGVAQLMMQSGMFVGAEDFRANASAGVFTHFKREEDDTMTRGKLDEELSRMSEIVEWLRPECLLLCNESFAATNEREGSEIARQIVRALLDRDIKVVFVTHMFDLAHGFYDQGASSTLFLRAERETDGRRSFKLVRGEPLPTSFGEDIYKKIFGAVPSAESVPETGRGISHGR